MPIFNNLPIRAIDTFDKVLINLKIINGHGQQLFDNVDKRYIHLDFMHQTWTLQILILGPGWAL
jgi:hypothetical protein